MKLQDLFLENWHKCSKKRYRVMLVVPSQKGLFPESIVAELAVLVQGKMIDFAERYQGSMETFLTRNTIHSELWAASKKDRILVTNLEPFYSKWPIDERLAFLRYLLRTEVPNEAALFLYCKENLAEISSLDEKSRGIIWAP
jgi:hypothetical protein